MWRLVVGVVLGLAVTIPLATALLWGIATMGIDPAADPTAIPTVCALIVMVALSGWGSTRLVRRGLSEKSGLRCGYLERFAQRSPAMFERPWAFNGFGLQYLDHGERDHEGWSTATLWLTAAHAPIAPVRRERIRLGPEREGSIPLVVAWTAVELERGERMAVDHLRSARVYAFYYLLLFPLLLAPFLAGLAWVVQHPMLPAWGFWSGLVGCLAWGIALIFLERRWMRRPRARRA